MSLLSTVEQAIKSYKTEQAQLDVSIQLYKEILHHLTLQPLEQSESGDVAAADTDASPTENEDMELLEQALQKALMVRTGTELSARDAQRNNLSGAHKEKDENMDGLNSSTAPKGSKKTLKPISKSTGLGRKGFKPSGLSACSTLSSTHSTSHKPIESKGRYNKNGIRNHSSSSIQAVHHQASKKRQQVVSASASPEQITSSLSKNKTVSSNMGRDNDPTKAASVSCSHTDGPVASNLLLQSGLQSDQATKWKSLRRKQNRLWEKVSALQRKPVPGRSHFMERMRAMFPKDWPCGSPDQTRALMDRLTHKGLKLAQHYRAEAFLAKQAPEMNTAPAGRQKNKDSCLLIEKLQLESSELRFFADHVKQEWKAWDRWRPEGGRLCPAGTNDVSGDEVTSPLPLTVTYTTEAELKELERLRMSVALLQQEIYLEQVLLESLSPQFSSMLPGPGRFSPSVLRDVYSLLGEGGERFPAIVLDSEPE
ncbi:uncharacterized protein LOC133421800 [Cololabis saira]|uniref:uncharacterized protein LOC133421800 n=1 Tax=Cololabis saira TaxID=129043 RepID=UPI002AD490C1|nr:uncharacterized protein LOC133421800 [Cololabis saira]